MTCKNCNSPINNAIKFCPNCGAEVVTQRITFKKLWKDFFYTVFGWDNKYGFTLKKLVTQPHIVLTEYLDGTRKKYVRPFTFLMIGTAISMLVFNQFSDEYMDFSRQMSEKQSEIIDEQLLDKHLESSMNKWTEEELKAIELKKAEGLEMKDDIQRNVLKYLNFLSFIFLPLYALISLLVYGKRYNYGEHLIINSYLQGTLFISGTLLFILSIFTHPSLYYLSLLISILYYLFVFGQLYQHSFGVLILKLLKFLLIVTLLQLFIYTLFFLVGLLEAKLGF